MLFWIQKYVRNYEKLYSVGGKLEVIILYSQEIKKLSKPDLVDYE